jgi:hypothetical protein
MCTCSVSSSIESSLPTVSGAVRTGTTPVERTSTNAEEISSSASS